MKLHPTSIRGRAVTSAVLAILIFGITLGIASYVVVTRIAVSSLADVIASQAGDVRAQILESGSKNASLPDLEAVEASKPVFIQVRDSSGAVLMETPGIARNTQACARQAAPKGSATELSMDLGRGQQPFLVIADSVRINGSPATICAFTSMSTVHVIQRNFLIFLIIGLPLVLVGVALSVRTALNRALGSVDDLRKQAEGISSSHDGILTVRNTQDEIERLGNTLNDLLRRLHDQSRATRQFVADAGHELRNPLATLRVLLEFNDSSDESYALAELDRLEELVQDLLVLAKVDAHELAPQEHIEVASILIAAVRTQQLRYPEINITIDTETVEILGDARQLRSAFDNLLSNACRHAAQSVQVNLIVANKTCEITIDDDGSGLELKDCERVFERFVRLDESRDRDEGGSGLGLAIVAAIASSMKASVIARPGPGGHFLLSIPALSAKK